VQRRINAIAEAERFLDDGPRRPEKLPINPVPIAKSNSDAAVRRPSSWFGAEQARILRLLIERIDVAPDGISVTLHAAGIRSLVAELADREAPALAASETLLEAAE
jgi:hypothetical protein